MTPDDSSMSLMGHLDELRSRIIKVLLALGLAFMPTYFFAEFLFDFLQDPLRQSCADCKLIGISPTEAFFTKIKVAFIAALFMASPAVFYQIWQFVAPGLYDNEKRYVWPFVAFCSFFFLLGAGFCYVVVLPIAYAFFLKEYESIGVEATLRISEYLAFTARTLLAFGVTFELPILAFFFARIGLVTHTLLISAFRYAVLVIFVLAAILTPPDAVSQVLLAMPLIILYGVSIGVAYFFAKAPKTEGEDTPKSET
jgi:sec-independent protein translocase protein TatC